MKNEKLNAKMHRVIESKKEWRRIKNEQAKGVKNPYKHFIQNIENYKNNQKITEVNDE